MCDMFVIQRIHSLGYFLVNNHGKLSVLINKNIQIYIVIYTDENKYLNIKQVVLTLLGAKCRTHKDRHKREVGKGGW